MIHVCYVLIWKRYLLSSEIVLSPTCTSGKVSTLCTCFLLIIISVWMQHIYPLYPRVGHLIPRLWVYDTCINVNFLTWIFAIWVCTQFDSTIYFACMTFLLITNSVWMQHICYGHHSRDNLIADTWVYDTCIYVHYFTCIFAILVLGWFLFC